MSIDNYIDQIICGDSREILQALPDESVSCCVTSPPYWGLRDYGTEDQIGLESTPEQYVNEMVQVFREVKRVLKNDGTLWLNLGDSYCPVNRGENARPRKETLVGISAGNPHSDLPTRKSTIQGVKAMGIKPKDLVGIPWRVAFALQADGWYLRQDIIWHKPNPMPESVRDRCTKSHEYVFLLSKSDRYFFDCEAIQETAVCGANGSEFHLGKTGEHQLGRASKKPRGPGNKTHKGETAYNDGDEHHRTKAGLVAYAKKVRESAVRGSFNGKTESMEGRNAFRAIVDKRNKRSVWSITTKPFKGAHFAVMPPDLVQPCVLAGSPEGGIVLDPFSGAGTTAMVAQRNGRHFIGIELNPEYCKIARKRLRQRVLF